MRAQLKPLLVPLALATTLASVEAVSFAATDRIGSIAAMTSRPATVEIPAEFRTSVVGSFQKVVFTKSSGQELNPIDRPAIEQLCRVARSTDGALHVPVFEAGYDQPLSFETWRFTNESHWGNYTITHSYVCGAPEGKSNSSDGLCDCRYQVLPKYRAQIKNMTPNSLEVIDLDFGKHQARRSMRHGRRGFDDETERGEVLMSSFAPEIIGKDVVAGIPCVVRRRRLGTDSHVDICVSDGSDEKLPQALRFRTLSEYMPKPDGTGTYRSSHADKIDLDAVVDSGAFAIPSGFSVKELK